MHGIDGDVGAGDAGGQLAGEQNVGQLGTTVGIHGGVALLALQVVETHPAPGRVVADRGEVDDPRRRALGEAGQEQPGEEEVTEMIDPERLLETLRGLLAFRPYPARVVDQHIEAVPSAQHVCGRRAHRGQVGEIERHHVHVVVARSPGDFSGGVVRFLLVATGQHGGRPLRRHPYGRLLPDAVVAARDDHDLALHAHHRSAFGEDGGGVAAEEQRVTPRRPQVIPAGW